MQETAYTGDDNSKKILQEFFKGSTKKEITMKMDYRLAELERKGHILVRRIKIGRNEPCPCGSGKKFKKCCIDKSK